MGLAEWIIDDTCLVFVCIVGALKKTFYSFDWKARLFWKHTCTGNFKGPSCFAPKKGYSHSEL